MLKLISVIQLQIHVVHLFNLCEDNCEQQQQDSDGNITVYQLFLMMTGFLSCQKNNAKNKYVAVKIEEVPVAASSCATVVIALQVNTI